MKPVLVAAVAAAAVGGGAVVYVVEDLLDPYPYPQTQPVTAPQQAGSEGGQAQPPAPEQPVQQPPADASAERPTAAGGLDAGQASEIALAEVPGTVVDTWPGREGGRDVWYVDVRSDDGAVLEVYVDATTGEVLQVEPD